MPTFDAAKQRLRESAILFGRNLRRWRLSNGWTQDTAHRWGESADFPHVYSSQWSQLETAVGKNPGPMIFHALGVINERMHRKDYGVIADRVTRDRVVAGLPILDADGNPWAGADWFAAYLGQLPFPDMPDPDAPPDLSREDAEQWSEQFRRWYQQTATAAQLEPLAAATRLLEYVDRGVVERTDFQRVVLGFADYDAKTLRQLWEGDRFAPERWIDAWRKAMEVAKPLKPMSATTRHKVAA